MLSMGIHPLFRLGHGFNSFLYVYQRVIGKYSSSIYEAHFPWLWGLGIIRILSCYEIPRKNPETEQIQDYTMVSTRGIHI